MLCDLSKSFFLKMLMLILLGGLASFTNTVCTFYELYETSIQPPPPPPPPWPSETDCRGGDNDLDTSCENGSSETITLSRPSKRQPIQPTSSQRERSQTNSGKRSFTKRGR